LKQGSFTKSGAQIGYGPKISYEVTHVRGMDKSPSPLQYQIPATITKMKKTFGESYNKY